MSNNLSGKILIYGVTESGQKFRPSDWAERISGNLSTFRHQRVHYSPLLHPARVQGINCLLVSTTLEESHPALFSQIMDFAQKNALKIQYPEASA